MDKNSKVSFVIPCYGSEKTLQGVVDDLRDVMEATLKLPYEIILVNDHSPDQVLSVIESLAQNDPEHIQGIDLSRNFGQHSALMAGYREATGDFVVSLDDDGQTPANAVPDMLDTLQRGFDVVYASYDNKRHHMIRNMGSKVNDWMAEKLIGKPPKLFISSFFIARHFIIKEIVRYENSYPYIQGLVLRTTRNIGNCPVIHRERSAGSSGYTLKKLLSLWLNGFTSFSVKPLRMATLCGFLCALFGFGGMIWMFVGHFIGIKPPMGYSSIMTALLFIGGMLMLMLGMIGEYVGRTFLCLNNAPQYVIRRHIKHPGYSTVQSNPKNAGHLVGP